MTDESTCKSGVGLTEARVRGSQELESGYPFGHKEKSNLGRLDDPLPERPVVRPDGSAGLFAGLRTKGLIPS